MGGMEDRRGAWVTVRKLDHSGQEMMRYPARVLRRDERSVVLAARREGPSLDLGYVTLERDDRWIETFYAGRWYNVFEIRAVDGRLKGWYCNVTRPPRITAAEVSAEDLALDLWVEPGGRAVVLDEEEFDALPLGAGERAAARAALAGLLALVSREGSPLAEEDAAVAGTQGEAGREPLEVLVGRLLREQGLTLATAESCTGGLVADRITDVPGSSDYYRGSVIAYADRVKEALLQVRPETLGEHGAVSREVAVEMARGVQRVVGVDVGLAVTGIAGPGGGTAEKPAGLVYIALVGPEGQRVERHLWPAGRRDNKVHSAEAALDLLRRYLQEAT
jgi:PncC family amidohydrolase